ncbi:four helix bundle protein [bacterium]|nr:four helix bundle protein [bacterium]
MCTTGVANFYDLHTWQVSHRLVLEIYKSTKAFPTHEKYALSDQLRRASSSITANIAEGFGRYHYKDKSRFYVLARGSCSEVQNFLILARDLSYISTERYMELFEISITSTKLLNGLIRSIRKNDTS